MQGVPNPKEPRKKQSGSLPRGGGISRLRGKKDTAGRRSHVGKACGQGVRVPRAAGASLERPGMVGEGDGASSTREKGV